MVISFSRLIASLGMLLFTVLIGRVFGPSGLGQLTYWLSISIVIGLIARIGLDGCLLKLTAIEDNNNNHYPQYMAFNKAVKTAFAVSLCLAILVLGVIWLANIDHEPFVVWILFSSPSLAILGIVAGYLRGRNLNSAAAVIDVGGVTMVVFVLLIVMWPFDVTYTLTGIGKVFFWTSAALALAGCLFCRSDIHRRLGEQGLVTAETRQAFHFDQFNFCFVMVGGFLVSAGSFSLTFGTLSDDALGILRAAERIATLIVFPTIAVNLMLSSRVAKLLATDNQEAIRATVRQSLIFCTVICVGICLPILLFPGDFLSVIGEEFRSGAGFLVVMTLAQLLMAICGPLLSALNYTNHGKQASKTVLFGAVIGVILFPFLSFAFGSWGFAAAYIIVAICRSVLIVYYSAPLFSSKQLSRPQDDTISLKGRT